MCIARKEDKENEEGNVKKIRDKKIEKIQKLNRARWNEIESETEEIKSKKIKKKNNQWVAQEDSWCNHHRTH